MAMSGAVTGVPAAIVAAKGVERPIYFCGDAIVMTGPSSRPARNHPAAPPTTTRSTAAIRMSLMKRIL
jgi:hypothetical protein